MSEYIDRRDKREELIRSHLADKACFRCGTEYPLAIVYQKDKRATVLRGTTTMTNAEFDRLIRVGVIACYNCCGIQGMQIR